MARRVRVDVGILCAWSILGGCAPPTARAAFPSQIVVAATADNELTAQTERWAADQLSDLMAYNGFDIILDHFPRVFQLHPSLHGLWPVVYWLPSLTSC